MKLLMKQMYGGLFPIDETGERFIARLGRGEIVPVVSRKPRNLAMHYKFWALCAFIAQYSEAFPTARHAEQWLLIKTGYCTVVEGKEIADSISFANMDQAEFDLMFNSVMDLVCQLIEFVDDQNVVQVLAEFAGVSGLLESN